MRESRGKFWKGDVLIADVEEMEKMDASEIDFLRITPKEVLMPHR